jgi:competence ComEA-like helix-hairpin-helix protein
MPLRVAHAWLLACILFFVSTAFPATKKPPAHPIDINTASSAQLQQVPGIGPATADKILLTRKSYGAFKTVDDLLSVRGIGPKKLEKMRKYLVAGHAAPGRRVGPSGASSSQPAKSSSAKKAAVVAPKAKSKPAGGCGEAADSDEEPE